MSEVHRSCENCSYLSLMITVAQPFPDMKKAAQRSHEERKYHLTRLTHREILELGCGLNPPGLQLASPRPDFSRTDKEESVVNFTVRCTDHGHVVSPPNIPGKVQKSRERAVQSEQKPDGSTFGGSSRWCGRPPAVGLGSAGTPVRLCISA
ncbi:hypothetical protein AV530_007943 [Patagioenas fasciata monilis]|uniref:Uncharacterized protein n=1 Tax=Patagioenas fasciata monilis TaxID=372326 RepID=A0A1V4KTR8_PATFA|nr:hypothetical protein AV530_007943 [Patagioenas fasciata monilis]